mgnify:CR=1 FL=1
MIGSSGRTGPGSGRPAKVYRRGAAEHQVRVPPRDHRTPALLLADVVAALETDRRAEDAARRAVGTIGEAEPRDADLAAVLAARGYQPYTDERGALRLRNRPFHLPAERQPTLVCAR